MTPPVPTSGVLSINKQYYGNYLDGPILKLDSPLGSTCYSLLTLSNGTPIYLGADGEDNIGKDFPLQSEYVTPFWWFNDNKAYLACVVDGITGHTCYAWYNDAWNIVNVPDVTNNQSNPWDAMIVESYMAQCFLQFGLTDVYATAKQFSGVDATVVI